MEFYEKDFCKILKQNALDLRRYFNLSDSDCGRVYDRNLMQYPVAVDLYGSYARITDYSESGLSDELVQSICDICRRMLYIERDKVVFQHRVKREGREQHEKQESEPLMVKVKENGLVFKVDLASHVDTGLFLDQANNRKLVEDESAGRDVLNLFSYTGSFSVYAARGGAKSVTSVDMSNTYTAWAEDNLRENGYEGDLYRCVASDAKDFVSKSISDKDKYDIIIFDPPCFSNSRKMDYDFDVQRDYASWLASLCRILRAGGFILFSTNLATFGMDGKLKRRNSIKEITAQTKAQGFTCRIGSARSWILEKDDEKLTLDWDDSAPVKKTKTVKKSTRAKKTVKEDAPVETAAAVAEDAVVAAVAEDAAVAAVAEDAVETAAAVAEDAVETAAAVAENADDETALVEIKSDDEDASEENVEEADEKFGQNEWNEEDDKPGKDDKPEYRRDRDDSYSSRDDRPSYGRDRDGRRDDRPSYGRDRDDRGGYGRRDDRGGYGRRDDRGGYGRRDDRPSYGRDRDGRSSYGDRSSSYGRRDDKPSYGRDRDDRSSSYGRRDDRPSYGRDRDDRSSSYGRRDDRPSYGRDRDDRSSSYGRRDDRPSYGRDRDDRSSSYGRRDDRPSFGRRDDRPSYGRRDDRPSYGRRDDSRSSSYGRGRDDRSSSYGRGRDDRKPYGYDSFKPARDRNDSKQFFWLDDDDSKDKDNKDK